MSVGAVVTVAGNDADGQFEGPSSAAIRPPRIAAPSPLAFWHVLGRSAVDHVCLRLRRAGIREISVISENPPAESGPVKPYASRVLASHNFWRDWDAVVSKYLNGGIETILLLRIGPYAEIHYDDLLRFHHQNKSSITHVHDQLGALDLLAVDAAELRKTGDSYRARLGRLLPFRRQYQFSGYTNRLKTPRDFRSLAQHALIGRSEIRPLGSEIQPGIWVGDRTSIHPSAQILSPAFIGFGARVRASCTVSAASTIEENCEIDCGTTIENCSILPGTYIGTGLRMSHSVAGEHRLYHLGRNVAVTIGDGRLVGTTPSSHKLVKGLKSLFARPATGLARRLLSTHSEQMASLEKSQTTVQTGTSR
jgi:carbonic anhydrase/acetyltransferase-like protein (isoleucine patch superfamily)